MYLNPGRKVRTSCWGFFSSYCSVAKLPYLQLFPYGNSTDEEKAATMFAATESSIKRTVQKHKNFLQLIAERNFCTIFHNDLANPMTHVLHKV